MAESHSHKFGQIIGELLEIAIQPHLEKFAKKNKLYLDKKGNRKARPGKKVTWTDNNGNKHDLDFAIERGGTDSKIGIPVAFIESAWRRYTKHSRNKAQEIQSAIIPLHEKYKNSSPFIGVVLAGIFTEGALNQLRSLGFGVLYFPYKSVIKAFLSHGIDASFDEQTAEENFEIKIKNWKGFTEKETIAKELIKINKKGVDEFLKILSDSVARYIDKIYILPLYGQETIKDSIVDAIGFLKSYTEDNQKDPFVKYEIIIRYNSGDRIDASFKDKKDAIKFLESYN